MKKVAVIGCGAYMDSGYGCPGEWRCLKAAALGEGEFDEPHQVVAFIKCECPGRSLAPNVKMALELSKMELDGVHMSTCMAKAKPECPYASPQDFAEIITAKTGLPVILGTHPYV